MSLITVKGEMFVILIPPINLAENYSIEFMYFALTISIAINGIYMQLLGSLPNAVRNYPLYLVIMWYIHLCKQMVCILSQTSSYQHLGLVQGWQMFPWKPIFLRFYLTCVKKKGVTQRTVFMFWIAHVVVDPRNCFYFFNLCRI